MKKLLLAFAICISTSFIAKAQTPPLNRQQTLDYINELVPIAMGKDKEVFVTKFSLIHTDLEQGPNRFQEEGSRYNLMNAEYVEIHKEGTVYGVWLAMKEKEGLMGYELVRPVIEEDDAKRLKKAFDHLIELVKKDGDPFGN